MSNWDTKLPLGQSPAVNPSLNSGSVLVSPRRVLRRVAGCIPTILKPEHSTVTRVLVRQCRQIPNQFSDVPFSDIGALTENLELETTWQLCPMSIALPRFAEPLPGDLVRRFCGSVQTSTGLLPSLTVAGVHSNPAASTIEFSTARWAA